MLGEKQDSIKCSNGIPRKGKLKPAIFILTPIPYWSVDAPNPRTSRGGIFKTHQSVWCMKILDSTGLVKEFGAMFGHGLKWLSRWLEKYKKSGWKPPIPHSNHQLVIVSWFHPLIVQGSLYDTTLNNALFFVDILQNHHRFILFHAQKKRVPFNDPWGLTPPFNCEPKFRPQGCKPLLNVSPPSSSLGFATAWLDGWLGIPVNGVSSLNYTGCQPHCGTPFLGERKLDSQLQAASRLLFFQQGGLVLQIFLGWGDMFVLEMGNIQRASSPKCWEKWSRHCLTPRLHRVSLWWPIEGAPAAFRQEATSKTWSGSWYVEIRIWISRLLLP